MAIRINGGTVVDPGNISGTKDLVIENGVITDILEPGTPLPDRVFEREIDAGGMIVTPGLVDMHVHLREPGFEYKETIETGCRSAVRGGFTAVCCMPNTNPVNDNSQVTEFIIKKAKKLGYARVYPAAAISLSSAGKNLCEYGELKEAGAVALTDDGMPVENAQLMRRALEYARGFGLPVISHCEVMELVAGGSMNEGPVATRLGLAGIPNLSESLMVMRDTGLAELTEGRIHIAHVSTRESVAVIREAKKRGVKVTAETAPHYFTLTDDRVMDYDTNAKMNPPLRSADDREAILEGLADGTLDAIATDHAPHSPLEKNVEFGRAANGIVGLESSLPLSLKLVENKILTMEDLVRKMSTNPASILGIPNGIKKGAPADITIIDPYIEYVFDVKDLWSKSRNTPFNGWLMKGRAVVTIVDGRIVYEI